MNKDELIQFIKDQMKSFNADMEVAEQENMAYDYAYADGAYNAYMVVLKVLEEME